MHAGPMNKDGKNKRKRITSPSPFKSTSLKRAEIVSVPTAP